MEVKAINTVGAKVGDRILLHFKSGQLLKVTFFLYVFPVLMLLLGALIGKQGAGSFGLDPTALSVATGIFGFGLAFWFVRSKSHKIANDTDYQPRIIRVLK